MSDAPPRHDLAATAANRQVDARRMTPPRWRHPRALAGVALISAAVLLGALAVSAAARTTSVWSVGTSVRAGEPVRATDLRRTEVRLGDAAATYVDADQQLAADGARWTRSLRSGELVPAGATGTAAEVSGVELPLSVAPGAAPHDLAVGDLVDVWTAPSADGPDRTPRAERVLEAVTVASVQAGDGLLAEGATRAVVVRVEDRPDLLADVLTRRGDGPVVLVRRAGSR